MIEKDVSIKFVFIKDKSASGTSHNCWQVYTFYLHALLHIQWTWYNIHDDT